MISTAKRKKAGLIFFDWTGLTLIVVVLIRLFVILPLPMVSSAMEPNYVQGEWMLFIRSNVLVKAFEKGDLLACYFTDPGQKTIKRLRGLPGEDLFVKDISGERKLTLPENKFFLTGDNEEHSLDSFFYGPIERKQILGRAIMVIWPLKAMRWINNNAQ